MPHHPKQLVLLKDMKTKCTSLRQHLGSEVKLQPWPHSLRMDSKPPRCWPSCPVKRCLSCLGTELIPDILPIKKHKIPLPAALSSTCWKRAGPEAQRCAGLALQICRGGKENKTPVFLELAGIPELRFRLVTLPPCRENQAWFFLLGGSVIPLHRLHNTKKTRDRTACVPSG